MSIGYSDNKNLKKKEHDMFIFYNFIHGDKTAFFTRY